MQRFAAGVHPISFRLLRKVIYLLLQVTLSKFNLLLECKQDIYSELEAAGGHHSFSEIDKPLGLALGCKIQPVSVEHSCHFYA